MYTSTSVLNRDIGRFNGHSDVTEVPAQWVVQRSLKAYTCANDACLPDWTCREGHYGRVTYFVFT